MNSQWTPERPVVGLSLKYRPVIKAKTHNCCP